MRVAPCQNCNTFQPNSAQTNQNFSRLVRVALRTFASDGGRHATIWAGMGITRVGPGSACRIECGDERCVGRGARRGLCRQAERAGAAGAALVLSFRSRGQAPVLASWL